MFNKLKNLILIFVIISIFLPNSAHALIIGDILAIPDAILGGIEEINITAFRVLIAFFIIYIFGVASLAFSSNLLEGFITQQGEWMVNLGGMTQAGWNFTAGLANMLLVLIFLIIAFAFIFKIETFQAKKALPKLIIVALLLNFSLLFVQMLVDITQILYNTILPDKPLFSTVMNVFIGSAAGIIATVLAMIGTLVVGWAIPIANAFWQIAFATIFATFLLPNIIIWAVQTIFFFLLSSMFLFFAFLFGARVFVIQILMILAPLAFLCLILPQTKSFWSQWFKTLLEWLLLGIFFLFFLVLGFSVVGKLAPTIGDTPLPGVVLGPWKIGGYITYYFAIFIYIGVILFLGKKFIPTSAQAMIDFGKGIAKTVLTVGLTPIGIGTVADIRKGLIKSKTAQDRAQKWATAKTPELKGWRKLGTPVVAPWYALRRRVGRAIGPGAIEAEKANISKAESGAEKIQTPDLLESKLLSATTDAERIAYFSAAIKKGGPFKKTFEEKYKDQAILAAAAANKIGAVPEAERIARSFLHKEENPQKREDMLREMGFKLKPEEIKKYGTVSKKLLVEAKGDQIKDFDKKLWAQSDIQETIHKSWTGEKVGFAGKEFHEDFLTPFQGTVKKNGAEWYLKNNPLLHRYLTSSPAYGLGVGLEETSPTAPAAQTPKARVIRPGKEKKHKYYEDVVGGDWTPRPRYYDDIVGRETGEPEGGPTPRTPRPAGEGPAGEGPAGGGPAGGGPGETPAAEAKEKDLNDLYKAVQSHSGEGARKAGAMEEIFKHIGLNAEIGTRGEGKEKNLITLEYLDKDHVQAFLEHDFFSKELPKLFDQKISENDRKKLLDQFVQEIKKVKLDFEEGK